MTLREKLIVLRDKAGITQMALAHQLGVSRQAVTRWESGDTTPSMDKLKALAKIYGVSLDWLCSESDMADEKPVEVVELLEDNATARAKNKKKRKFRCVAIVVVVCVITLTCIWIATRSENNEMPSKQFVDMGDESVDIRAYSSLRRLFLRTLTISARIGIKRAQNYLAVSLCLFRLERRLLFLRKTSSAIQWKIPSSQHGIKSKTQGSCL